MRRRQPAISAERAQELWNDRTAAGESVTVQCRLVTPMYGGGVHTGEVDKAMPIRASGLRGQLRLWWRLLYGGGRASEKQFQDECELWGGIAGGSPNASKIALRVASEPAASFVRKGDVPPYALILESNDDPTLLKEGYSFKVVLGFDDGIPDSRRRQVVESLRWWASFGGVGSRTRRGLGAVNATSDDADLSPVSSSEVEGSGGWVVAGPQMGQPLQAWRVAVDALRTFRQGPGVGRTSGAKGRPGSSNWPEANTIRRLADSTKPLLAERDVIFPRAAFGLPIVFQFKGERHLNDTLEAEGDGRERMASPLILRPHFDGSKYRAVALLLPGWQHRLSESATLRGRGRVGRLWPSDTSQRKRAAQGIAPMAPLGDDPLTAFMRYFDERVNGKQNSR